MPIQPMTFQYLPDANPLMTGMKQGTDIASAFMDNLRKSIAMKYDDKNQQAALALAQAQVPHLQAQTQEILQGQIPYQQAQVRGIDQGQIPLDQAQARDIYQGRIPLQQAQAAAARARANPFNNPEGMPDLIKAQMFYSHIKDTFGEDSPQAKEALNNYRMMQSTATAQTSWKDQLAQSMMFRALPNISKEMLGQQQVSSGVQPSAVYSLPVGGIDSRTFTPAMGQQPQANYSRPFGQSFSPQQQQPQLMQGQPQQQQPQQQPQAQQQVQQPQGQPYPQDGGIPLNAPADMQKSLYNNIAKTIDTPVKAQQLAASNPSVAANLVANGTDPLTSKEMAGFYTNKLIKETGTADNMNKILYGSQVQQSIANMLPYEKAMEQYSGGPGQLNLLADKIKSGTFRKDSPQYLAYQGYVSTSTSTAEQLINYWGTSIQPESLKRLTELTNPAAWNRSPAAARASLNGFLQNFNSELNQRKRATIDPNVYLPDGGDSDSDLAGTTPQPTMQQSADYLSGKGANKLANSIAAATSKSGGNGAQSQNTANMVRIIKPNGEHVMIPSNNLEKAIKLGAKRA